MALNYKAVANILREKGWEDFKPFKLDSSAMEVWGFKTKESNKTYFHFCDSDFKEVNRGCAQLATGPLFILETLDDYSICPEGFSVNDYNSKKQIHEFAKCWLITIENEILNSFWGYTKLCGNFYLLEPSLIDIASDISTNNSWKPESAYPAFNIKESLYRDPTDVEHKFLIYEYYGTYFNYHFMRKYDINKDTFHYFVLNSKGESIFSGYPALWRRTDCELCIISVMGDNNKWNLNYYDGENHSSTIKSLFKFGYGDYEEYYADDNIMVIKLTHYKDYFEYENQKSYYLLILDKEGKVLYQGEYNLKGNIYKIVNGFILVYDLHGKYKVYHCSTRLIAEAVDLKEPYFLFPGAKGFNPSSETGDEYTLFGIMKSSDMSVVVPAIYESVDIVETEPKLVAIVGNKHYEDGAFVSRKGLYVNSELKIPLCNYITKLRDNKKKEEFIVWEKDEKYGLLYHGEECLPPIYDDIYWDDFIRLCIDDNEGAYSKKLNFLSEIAYNDVKLLEKEKIFIADDDIYFINDGATTLLIKAEPNMKFLASRNTYYMYRDRSEEIGYKCYRIFFNGKVAEQYLSECDGYRDIRCCDDDGNIYYTQEDFRPGSYITVDHGSFYFDMEEECFYLGCELVVNDVEEYDQDDWDWRREIEAERDFDRMEIETGWKTAFGDDPESEWNID